MKTKFETYVDTQVAAFGAIGFRSMLASDGFDENGRHKVFPEITFISNRPKSVTVGNSSGESVTVNTASEISKAAAALGRKGGSANTEAQNAARAENAKRGGRPVKGHSKKNISAVRRWWRQNRNVWEISRLTGLSESLIQEMISAGEI